MPKYISKWCGEILHIFEPVYQQNYYYFNCKTEKDYNRLLKMRFKLDRKVRGRDGGFEVYENTGTDVGFIWTRNGNNLAHECFHAISYCLRRSGIELSDATEESYAYLLQFLVKEIKEQLRSKND